MLARTRRATWICPVLLQGMMLMLNAAALSLFGYQKGELEGKNVSMLMYALNHSRPQKPPALACVSLQQSAGSVTTTGLLTPLTLHCPAGLSRSAQGMTASCR